ncbi:MAG TPA: complex I subunit 1 family protein [Candidatus Cybelea sp.]|nr:complex I subunit 1 family protein [Candidatus Cybelea sp.]
MNHLIPTAIQQYVLPVLYGIVIVAILPLLAGYIVLMERKVMADMQARLGPMRVGPHGLLQPIADALKLLIKEDIIPEHADRFMFWMAPVLSVGMALLAYAAIPFGPVFQVADLNVGLLFILAVSSLGIYGIVLGGWASNSHYSLLGALRSAAQLVSYETAAGLGLVSALIWAGSLSMKSIVEAQYDRGDWFIAYVPVGFFIYLVGSIAETNRAPFDLPEAESELVAGYMTEYSGFRWALYFLGEYANMMVVASIATTLFLGGWLRPFVRYHDHFPGTSVELLDIVPSLIFLFAAAYCLRLVPRQPVKIQRMVMAAVAGLCLVLSGVMAAALLASPGVMAGIHGAFWFLAKVFAYIYGFLWFRFTFPRYRFDQLMRLGWRFLIPLSLVNVIATAVAVVVSEEWGLHPLASALIMQVLTLGVALWLAGRGEEPAAREPQVAEGD